MTLGLATATSTLSVAIVEHGRVIASATAGRHNVHDDLLIPFCRDVVTWTGRAFDDIQQVAVTSGPGSYTGLRIGMAAGKGICLALNIPLVPVPTCDAIAFAATRMNIVGALHIGVFLDAKNDEVYAATYLAENGCFAAEHAPAILPAMQAATRLRDASVLLGDGSKRVAAYCSAHVRLPIAMDDVPHAVDVALLGEINRSDSTRGDVAEAEPNYMRDFPVKPARNMLSGQ